jgi:peroxiredoxin
MKFYCDRKTPARALIVALMLLVVAALAACGAPKPAPDVTFTTLSGRQLSMQDLRGKVVVVNFWATTCAVCVKEMPDMAGAYQRFHDRGFELVAVAMRYDPPNRVLDFVGREKLPFSVALDPLGQIEAAFGGVPGTPTTFIIDKRGDIVQRIVGAPDFPRLRTLLDAKLRETT